MSTLVRHPEQRRRDAEGESRAGERAAGVRSWPYVALVVAAGLLVAAPAIVLKYPPITDDAPYHAVWYTQFAKQLWAGDAYPRWLSGMNGGLGSPSLFYYSPLPYYLTAWLRPLFASDAQGWQQLGLGAAAALVGSGVASFLWLRRAAHGVPVVAAAAGAVCYMLTPYHAAVDLYTRGAYAEFWAFVWMPLVLLCVRHVAEGSRRAVVGLAVVYALLITSHLPTTLLFSVVPPAYSLLVAPARGRLRGFVLTCVGMTLGIGLASVYLLPAVAMQGQVNAAREGFYHYGRWFLFNSLKLWGDETSKLTAMLATVLGFVVCCFVLLWRATAENDVRREAAFWGAVAAASVLMMTPLSSPVWQLVGPLQAVQFPYRFNTVLAVAVSAILCLALAATARRRARFGKLQTLATAGLCLSVCVWLAATVLAARSAFFETNTAPADAERIASAFRYNADFAEYAPRWAETVRQGELVALLARLETLPDKRVSAAAGASVEVQRWQPRDIALAVNAREETWVTISQLYYPGWTARVEGERRELNLRPSANDGLVEVLAPRGSHALSVKLEPGRAERAGKIISLASVACCALLLFYLYAKRRRGVAA